jgi:hypothetical protein
MIVVPMKAPIPAAFESQLFGRASFCLRGRGIHKNPACRYSFQKIVAACAQISRASSIQAAKML